MNTAGLLLVWVALQVSVFCLAAGGWYLLLRRRGPAAGAWAAEVALGTAVVITGLALSPWPQWWSLDSVGEQAPATGQDPISPVTEDNVVHNDLGTRDELTPPIRVDNTRPLKGKPAEPAGWQSTMSGLRREVNSTSAALATPEWKWPAWLALAVAVGCIVAVARLLVAVVGAVRCRRRAKRVTDPALLDGLQAICRQIDCTRAIEVRESAELGSPATLGWLRPVILLPEAWTTWNDDERRAVLAHEVAHVARGDFAAALVGQVGAALHFYNPLVHWLCRRLRLEQEMAADVWGAVVLGSRERYLSTLAQMALRTSDPLRAWAMQPFLPTRGTLMRRVEMLHARKTLPSLVAPAAGRGLGLVVLAVLGLLVAGVRGPQGRRAAEAAEPAAGQQAFEPSLDYVPGQAAFVVGLRPDVLGSTKSLVTLRSSLDKLGMFAPLGVPLEEIEDFKLVGSGNVGQRGWLIMVLRSKKPHDWSGLGKYFTGETEKVVNGPYEYFRGFDAPGAMFSAYALPDERTIVLTRADAITAVLGLRGKANQPRWRDRWNQAARSPAAMMLRGDVLANMFGESGVAEDAVAMFTATEREGRMLVEGRLDCDSPEAAKKIAGGLQKRFATTRDAQLKGIEQSRSPNPNSIAILQIIIGLIDTTFVEADGATVVSRTEVEPGLGAEFVQLVGPAREAARRQRSISKLRQILIALHVYHDKHGHFPPAVVMGPDGKTPHSWRVELLPYMNVGKVDLYQRYRLDEPWDSEHNRKLIAEGAEIFSVPGDEASDDCGYYLLVGPGTVFDPDQPPTRVRDIRDGTSNTIGIVEAKRAIPWTKPEDIACDPAGPLPKLGGYFEGGFDAAMMDGSVHFLTDKLDEKTLRALITRGGREEIGYDSQTGELKVE